MRAVTWAALAALMALAPGLEAQEGRAVIPPGATIARAAQDARFARDQRTVDTRLGAVTYTPVATSLTRDALQKGVVVGRVQGPALSKLSWARGSRPYAVYLRAVDDDWQVAFEQGGEVVHVEPVSPALQTIIIVECLEAGEGTERSVATPLPVLDVLLPALNWRRIDP